MKRVVVTGIGIVSSIGDNKESDAAALRAGKSGIVYSDEYEERGFRSHVHGAPKIDIKFLKAGFVSFSRVSKL